MHMTVNFYLYISLFRYNIRLVSVYIYVLGAISFVATKWIPFLDNYLGY